MLILAYRAEEIMRFFWPQNGQTLPLRPILGVLSLLVGVALVVWVVKAIGRRAHQSEPMRQFTMLAGQMGLSWGQQWTLYRIAQRCKLSNPMTLLVCDAVLTHYTDRLTQDMGPVGAAQLQRQVAAIRDRLFGSA